MRDTNPKILLITMLFPNSREPAKATFNLQIAQGLAKYTEIKVVAPVRIFPHTDTIPAYEKIAGIDVYHPRLLLPPKIALFSHGFLYFMQIAGCLKKISENFNFDGILAPYLYPDGFAGVLTAKALRKPVVLEALGCDVNLLTKYAIRRAQIQYACENANAIISVNKHMKERLVKIGVEEKKITVIYNGVNRGIFKPLDKYECRQRLNLAPEENIVLFAGNLERVKGIRILIEAWREIMEERGGKNLLVVVGSGREKGAITRLVKQYKMDRSVRMAGPVPHTDIPLWMNACDLFCLPSIREGYPNVLLEAISCDKYIVATNTGGIPEIVTSPDVGILVEPNNSKSLSGGLKAAISLTARGAKAKTVPGLSSWEDSARERLRLFQKVCST